MNTKMLVLSVLTDAYISGECISRKLGLSRASVNLAVKALRADGYIIQASTNTGYRLIYSPDKLSTIELHRRIPDASDRIIALDTVTSTNDYLKALAANGAPAGTVVFSEQQTKGKGRMGKTFVSPAGSGLYFSYLLKPNVAVGRLFDLTARIALTVRDCLASFIPEKQVGVKWVNDIIAEGKKLCGILSELSVEAESGNVLYAVIGIGINVNTDVNEFPAEIREYVGSMYSVSGRKIDRLSLAASLVAALDAFTVVQREQATESSFRQYEKACVTLGKDVCFCMNGVTYTGKALRLNSDYSLTVLTQSGEVSVSSGDVSVRGLCGYC